jgi:hypothetical protein
VEVFLLPAQNRSEKSHTLAIVAVHYIERRTGQVSGSVVRQDDECSLEFLGTQNKE